MNPGKIHHDEQREREVRSLLIDMAEEDFASVESDRNTIESASRTDAVAVHKVIPGTYREPTADFGLRSSFYMP